MMKKLGKVPETTTEEAEAMTAPQGKNMGHVELTLASYATQLMVMCTQPTNNEEKEPHFSANRIFAIFKSGARKAEVLLASEAN